MERNFCAYSAIIRPLNLVTCDQMNAKTKEGALELLAQDLMEYAQEYIDDFDRFYRSSNRKDHFPYVVKVLLQKDLRAVMDLLHA